MTGRTPSFAAPRRTAEDVARLERLAAVLAARAAAADAVDGWQRFGDARAHYLLLVPSWRRLARRRRAAGVGFVGRLRPDPDDGFPPGLEPAVADAAVRDGWLLAYLNARFRRRGRDGAVRYANLVVVTSRAATGGLAGDPAHVDAVRRAPATYRSIRIHRLDVDLVAAGPIGLRLRETLLLDYDAVPPWREVREAPSPARS